MRVVVFALLGLLAAGCDDDTVGPGSDDMATIGGDDLGSICDPSACPAQTTVCKSNVCAANACAVENAAAGTSCSDSGGVVCDGHGSCVAMHCMDQLRDADETDVDCGGASCAGCANGKMCSAGADCATGFCSSHTCSARAAGASCSANAQCASSVCGINGSGNCCSAACTTGGSCGASACSGSGACVYPGSSVACGTPSCSAAMLTVSACDASGSCKSGTPASCPNHLACASATSCFTMCGGDPDCASGYYCGSGCQPQGAVGAACTLGDQCLGGNCVDGFCCNSSCTGACQACAASLTGGANGMCLAATDGQTDPRGVCGSSANVCRAGACSGVPGVPGAVTATGGASSATVQWTVPSANGAAIDKYVITGAGAPINLVPANVCTGSTVGSACSYMISPLTDCVAYTFGVTAHNINGSSATASSNTVTPAQRPDAPSGPSEIVPASPGARMSVSWTAPNAHGCAIDDYDVYISGPANGGDHVVGLTLSTTFSGLTTCAYPSGMCSSPYTFSVRAHNSGGWSDYSGGTAAIPKVSYTSDNLPGIWSAKGCTGCHTAGFPPVLDTPQAYTNASAEGSLIYLCPENASASCPGHMVLFTVGSLEDTTLRTWVSDGNYQ